MNKSKSKPRIEAATRGESTYLGNPCKRGHSSARRCTITGGCTECQRILQARARGFELVALSDGAVVTKKWNLWRELAALAEVGTFLDRIEGRAT